MSLNYTLIYRRAAVKYLEKLDAITQQRIVEGIKGLAEIPQRGDRKKLKNKEGFRLRVGDYRIRYAIDLDSLTVTITTIAHRKDVYKN